MTDLERELLGEIRILKEKVAKLETIVVEYDRRFEEFEKRVAAYLDGS